MLITSFSFLKTILFQKSENDCFSMSDPNTGYLIIDLAINKKTPNFIQKSIKLNVKRKISFSSFFTFKSHRCNIRPDQKLSGTYILIIVQIVVFKLCF